MILKRLKADVLAHNSYFIGSEGEAVVIDPRREAGDVEEILGLARESCAQVKHILETHRNEDFVHGSKEIAERTGATIGHGGRTPFKYGEPLRDGDEVAFGGMSIRAVETPGHTSESLTYVLYDGGHPGVALAAFTGDALFVSSTGRIDLPGTDQKTENARKLYESLHERILPLGDHVLLCPAHGAGSVCGAGMGDRDWSTIGYEKRTNPHLQLGKDEFVEHKANELFVRPPYFLTMEKYNLDGPPSLAQRASPAPMRLHAFKETLETGESALIDTRLQQAFGGGHIPGSYNIWLKGTALFPGWLFAPGQKLLLLADRDEDALAADRYLCRIGYDDIAGYLCGGFEAWQNAGLPIGHTGEISVDALKLMLDRGDIALVDVREPREWAGGTVKGAIRIYVGDLKDHIRDLPSNKPVATMCSVGHRGSLGASILQRSGIVSVYNVLGGMAAWKGRKYPLVRPGEP
jgi:hydroxyacylglutathione hydrolase